MNKESFYKGLAYNIMAIVYYLSYLFPINRKKILLIMTHDSSDQGNVGSVYRYLQQKNPELIFKKVNRDNYAFKRKNLFRNLFFMFVVLPYHIATSMIIFMDNVFLPFSAIKPKNDTKLVQLWHGTGSLKKFGMDFEEGWIKKRGLKVNLHTTHFIVGSTWMKEIYKTAFRAPENKIYNIGCPRTDIFFDKKLIKEAEEEFSKKFPQLNDKTFILYAPTFRDDEETSIELDIEKFMSNMDEKIILGLRLHPKIAKKFELGEIVSKNHWGRVFNFSRYPKLNTLLINTDILITDYSSIIYEFAIMKKPIIFYSYDLEKFEKSGRGFYKDYKSNVPGPIARNTQELVDIIKKKSFMSYDMDLFQDVFLDKCDGNSRKRLYNLLLN
ncbi:MAG: CDP-glycerol glycerophosphotransferase family protein [Methanobacteriaceae archaeon]